MNGAFLKVGDKARNMTKGLQDIFDGLNVTSLWVYKDCRIVSV
uniref:Uncharacterized protein n=1 Tax=Arundo donax TaxID=35708 RepID=A0A0A8ZG15_ARUDO